MAIWTAPRWRRTASTHHLWLVTSEFNHCCLNKGLLCDWSFWAVTSTVSLPMETELMSVIIVYQNADCVCASVWLGCSLPLGLQKREIHDSSFSASSFYSSLLRNWIPSLARLHQEGSANAWRPKVSLLLHGKESGYEPNFGSFIIALKWPMLTCGQIWKAQVQFYDLTFQIRQAGVFYVNPIYTLKCYSKIKQVTKNKCFCMHVCQ